MAAPPRRLLIAVDDTPECEHALAWTLANVYRCVAVDEAGFGRV